MHEWPDQVESLHTGQGVVGQIRCRSMSIHLVKERCRAVDIAADKAGRGALQVERRVTAARYDVAGLEIGEPLPEVAQHPACPGLLEGIPVGSAALVDVVRCESQRRKHRVPRRSATRIVTAV